MLYKLVSSETFNLFHFRKIPYNYEMNTTNNIGDCFIYFILERATHEMNTTEDWSLIVDIYERVQFQRTQNGYNI